MNICDSGSEQGKRPLAKQELVLAFHREKKCVGRKTVFREFEDCEFRLSHPDIRILPGIQFPRQLEVKGQKGEPAPPVRIPIVKSPNKQLKRSGRGVGGG